MTDEDFSIHRTRWNIINIDDAKGLEFSSVIVISGRMSRNEKYIAYTRALDELFVYPEIIDISEYEKKIEQDTQNNMKISMHGNIKHGNNKSDIEKTRQSTKHVKTECKRDYGNSEVCRFFKDNGLEVIDKRADGGRLWVIGEKTLIRDIVNAAISKFGISGKYASSKERGFKNGWCTKTDE